MAGSIQRQVFVVHYLLWATASAPEGRRRPAWPSPLCFLTSPDSVPWPGEPPMAPCHLSKLESFEAHPRAHCLQLSRHVSLCYTRCSCMAHVRIEELKTLLPQCLLPDWVRLGRRLGRLLRDHHHPDQRDALLERLRQQVLASMALREERRLNVDRK